MTSTEEIHELLEYDAWATGQILEAVTTLGGAAPGSAASWTRNWNGTPRTSLRQQLVHLVITVDTYRALRLCCMNAKKSCGSEQSLY